jgi:hypothetical protein
MIRRRATMDNMLGKLHGFVTEWTVSGDVTARTITLPLVTGYNYNCIVDWGDGTKSTVTAFDDVNRIHTYSKAGVFTVEITGTCEGWSFNDTGDKLKITNIKYWGHSTKFNGFKYLISGFYGCSNLKSLGKGIILASGNGCSNFQYTFRSCTSLTSIPVDLFRYNVNVSESGFVYTFYGCTKLTSIPVDLFRYNVNVSISGFYGTFYNCTKLTSIPVDLFRYNVNVSISGFRNTFYGCTSLTSIPVDLFRYNVNVSTSGFHHTFRSCTSLTSIPVDLFRYNVNVSTYGFYGTFQGCTKLQLNKWIFYASGEEGTRFLNRTSDFTECFSRTSFTGTQGEAPELWNCNFGTQTPLKTNCFSGGGNSLTSLTNYNDIPNEWKGL